MGTKAKDKALTEVTTPPEETAPPAKAREEPRDGTYKGVVQTVVVDSGSDDGLYDDLKLVKVDNLALNTLASDLEEIDVDDLLEACLSLARSMFPGTYQEQAAPAPAAVEDNQEPTSLGEAKAEGEPNQESDDGQKLQMAEEELREAEEFLERGMLEEAQDSYEQALQLNPGDETAKARLNNLLEAKRKLSDAQSRIRQEYPSPLEHGRALLVAIQELEEAKALLPSMEGSERVREIASDGQAAIESLVDRMLETASKSMAAIDNAESMTSAISACDDVVTLLELAREIDAANPKVQAAIAAARDRASTLAAAQEPLDRAAMFVEENAYEGLAEAADLLRLVQSSFPNEPRARLLLGKIRDRYLERAEEAVAHRDWRAAQCWLAEASKDVFSSLPGDERRSAIQRQIKKLQRRGWILRGAAAVVLSFATVIGGTFVWGNSTSKVNNSLLQRIPLLSPQSPSGEAPSATVSPSPPKVASETNPLSPVPMNPNPGCVFESKYGHNVCDDSEVAFKGFWQKHQLVLGTPITEKRVENGLMVQYFENARLEFHPGNPERYRIEVGLLGYLKDASLEEYQSSFLPQAEGKADKAAEGAQFHDATKHYLGNNHLFRQFWEANGGLEIFGNPISEEFLPKETGRYRQHFERAIFEYYEESQPPSVRLVPLGLKYAQASGWAP